MKFLSLNHDIRELEKPVKNAFGWEWMERQDSNGDTVGTWCKKKSTYREKRFA